MQSLENGMVLLGASSAIRQIAIGVVLVLAVWVDVAARRRSSDA
jgi:D-xylose transport system permease protein